MNLICPHCQQMVSAPDSSAGQLMKCPLCNESFSVPSLPQPASSKPLELPADAALAPPDVAPTPPLTPLDTHEEPVYKVVPEPPKPPPPPPPRREPRPVTPSPASSSAVVSPPLPRQGSLKLRINPEYLPWIVPIALTFTLFLMFFPWVGAYPGGFGVYTQTGFQTIWGGFSVDPVGEKVLLQQKEIEDHISANWFRMTLYLLLILGALALLIWPIVQARGGVRTPPALEAIAPWRSTLLVVVLLLAFVFLFLQVWRGSGLEDALTAPIDTRLEKDRAAAQNYDEKTMVEIRRGQLLGSLGLRATAWLYWEVIFLLIVLGGASLELWMEKRPDHPLPHAELSW
jgi:hypothetical protein